jgi:hypothetical protein
MSRSRSVGIKKPGMCSQKTLHFLQSQVVRANPSSIGMTASLLISHIAFVALV